VGTKLRSGLLFTFRQIPIIAGQLAVRGIEAAPLLTRAGLSLDGLRGEITAPLTRIQTFVDLVARTLDNDLFGLDLAELVPTGAYGLSEFLARSAPTIADGLLAVQTFSVLINPSNKYKVVQTPEGASVHYSVGTQRDTLGMQLNEYSMRYVARQGDAVLGGRLPLVRAWFSHKRTKSAHVVAERFGCPVSFGAPDCGFVIARADLARRGAAADPPLFAFLLEQARAQIARSGVSDIVTQLLKVLDVRLGHGDVTISEVASAMAITARSLQRHLGEAGTSYRDVLHHVRCRRRGELAQRGLSESDIARELGFYDARAMRRSLDAEP
jgi:AraC-like DNA-binding protein